MLTPICLRPKPGVPSTPAPLLPGTGKGLLLPPKTRPLGVAVLHSSQPHTLRPAPSGLGDTARNILTPPSPGTQHHPQPCLCCPGWGTVSSSNSGWVCPSPHPLVPLTRAPQCPAQSGPGCLSSSSPAPPAPSPSSSRTDPQVPHIASPGVLEPHAHSPPTAPPGPRRKDSSSPAPCPWCRPHAHRSPVLNSVGTLGTIALQTRKPRQTAGQARRPHSSGGASERGQRKRSQPGLTRHRLSAFGSGREFWKAEGSPVSVPFRIGQSGPRAEHDWHSGAGGGGGASGSCT